MEYVAHKGSCSIMDVMYTLLIGTCLESCATLSADKSSFGMKVGAGREADGVRFSPAKRRNQNKKVSCSQTRIIQN